MYNIELQEIKQARVENRAVAEFRMYMRSGPDRRRYNQPTTHEVAAIFGGGDGSPPLHDFSVFSNDGKVRAIPITSPHCYPMTYPLLFPFGHLGWQMRIPRIAANKAPNSRANITLGEHLIHISIRYQYSAIHIGRGAVPTVFIRRVL